MNVIQHPRAQNPNPHTIEPKTYIQTAIAILAKRGNPIRIGKMKDGVWDTKASQGARRKVDSLDALVEHLKSHNQDRPTYFAIRPSAVNRVVLTAANENLERTIELLGSPLFHYPCDMDNQHLVYPSNGATQKARALVDNETDETLGYVVGSNSLLTIPRLVGIEGWMAHDTPKEEQSRLNQAMFLAGIQNNLTEKERISESVSDTDLAAVQSAYERGQSAAADYENAKGLEGDSISVRLERILSKKVNLEKPAVKAEEPDFNDSDVFKQAMLNVVVRKSDDWRDLMGLLNEFDIEFRLDLSSKRYQWRWKGTGQFGWQDLEDTHDSPLRCFIGDTFKVEGKTGFRKYNVEQSYWKLRLSMIVDRNQQDPFKVYLETLPKHDGNERLKTLLPDVFGSQGKLAEWGGKAILLACVQRTYEPGCKVDESIVLVSNQQGLGKSHFCSALFPKEARWRWFTDCLNLSGSHKENVEAIRGRVLAELSEMGGMTKSDLGKVKRFWTSQTDSVRFSYAHYESNLKRRTVFVATTDREDCLPPDSAGHRRFVPVHCVRGLDIEPYMDDVREQLWAEAVNLYKQGERANLPRQLMAYQAQGTQTLQAIDRTLQGRLSEALANFPIESKLSPKLAARFANEDCLGDVSDRQAKWVKKYSFSGRQISDALSSLGFKRMRSPSWNAELKVSERMYQRSTN